VVPGFQYSVAVITTALNLRESGLTRAAAAARCTADGQVDPAVVRRWERRFTMDKGRLHEIQPTTSFRRAQVPAILALPAENRSSDPPHEDHWAHSPPLQP